MAAGTSLVRGGPAKGVGLPTAVARQAVLPGGVPIEQLVLGVILLVPVLPPPPLLQHHHRKAGHRQLLGHDAPGGPGPDDDEVNLTVWRELCHGDFSRVEPRGPW